MCKTAWTTSQDERAHPEKREEIKQARLRHIQRRKSRNETP